MTRSQARATMRVACGLRLPRARASAYSRPAQGDCIPSVVREGGEGVAGAGVGDPAEIDATGLARGPGDRHRAAFGGGLLGVADAVKDRTDFGQHLGQVDGADSRERAQKRSYGTSRSWSTICVAPTMPAGPARRPIRPASTRRHWEAHGSDLASFLGAHPIQALQSAAAGSETDITQERRSPGGGPA